MLQFAIFHTICMNSVFSDFMENRGSVWSWIFCRHFFSMSYIVWGNCNKSLNSPAHQRFCFPFTEFFLETNWIIYSIIQTSFSFQPHRRRCFLNPSLISVACIHPYLAYIIIYHDFFINYMINLFINFPYASTYVKLERVPDWRNHSLT